MVVESKHVYASDGDHIDQVLFEPK